VDRFGSEMNLVQHAGGWLRRTGIRMCCRRYLIKGICAALWSCMFSLAIAGTITSTNPNPPQGQDWIRINPPGPHATGANLEGAAVSADVEVGPDAYDVRFGFCPLSLHPAAGLVLQGS
jgi:hypothetical protein